MSKQLNKFFNAAKTDDTLTMSFFDMIGENWQGTGATPQMVSDALKGDFKNIEIHLNSPGGDAFAGVAIYNLLKASSKPINVVVDGLAASAASIVACAGDTVTMNTGSMMMIHEAMSMAFGNADDMTKMAETLTNVTSSIADIYVARTGLKKADILTMQNVETWMTAQEAVDKGFATKVGKTAAVKNEFKLDKFKNAPADLKVEAKGKKKPAPADDAQDECQCDCSQCNDDDAGCDLCSNDSCSDPICDCYNQDDADDAPTNAAPAFDLVSMLQRQLELNKRR
jgi:ATP-dependent Clp protease, protease subunit